MLKRLSHERNVLTVMHVGMLPRLETALHHRVECRRRSDAALGDIMKELCGRLRVTRLHQKRAVCSHENTLY